MLTGCFQDVVNVLALVRIEYGYTLTISRMSPFWQYSVPCFSHRLIGLLVVFTVGCHFILKEHPSTWHTASPALPPSSVPIISPYFVVNKRITLEYRNELMAIHPRHNKLITALRTAVENGEGYLDKEATSHDDLFDSFRLSLMFWYWLYLFRLWFRCNFFVYEILKIRIEPSLWLD